MTAESIPFKLPVKELTKALMFVQQWDKRKVAVARLHFEGATCTLSCVSEDRKAQVQIELASIDVTLIPYTLYVFVKEFIAALRDVVKRSPSAYISLQQQHTFLVVIGADNTPLTKHHRSVDLLGSEFDFIKPLFVETPTAEYLLNANALLTGIEFVEHAMCLAPLREHTARVEVTATTGKYMFEACDGRRYTRHFVIDDLSVDEWRVAVPLGVVPFVLSRFKRNGDNVLLSTDKTTAALTQGDVTLSWLLSAEKFSPIAGVMPDMKQVEAKVTVSPKDLALFLAPLLKRQEKDKPMLHVEVSATSLRLAGYSRDGEAIHLPNVPCEAVFFPENASGSAGKVRPTPRVPFRFGVSPKFLLELLQAIGTQSPVEWYLLGELDPMVFHFPNLPPMDNTFALVMPMRADYVIFDQQPQTDTRQTQ